MVRTVMKRQKISERNLSWASPLAVHEISVNDLSDDWSVFKDEEIDFFMGRKIPLVVWFGCQIDIDIRVNNKRACLSNE